MRTFKDIIDDIKNDMSYDEAQTTIVRSLNNGTLVINGGLVGDYDALELKAALIKAMDAMSKLKEIEEKIR